ncbi:hypothetical protein BH09ACT7_BH09ACT7_04630 [soil metagenome]
MAIEAVAVGRRQGLDAYLRAARHFCSLPVNVQCSYDECAKRSAIGGARAGVRSFIIPLLVVSLKHADDLGDAMTARGVG